jgi:hypothetical protein
MRSSTSREGRPRSPLFPSKARKQSLQFLELAVDRAECPFSTTFTHDAQILRIGPSHGPPESINEGQKLIHSAQRGNPPLPIQPKMKML